MPSPIHHRVACAVAVLLALAAGGAQAQTRLRFSTAAPPPDFLTKSLESFKAMVDRDAPGAFKIDIYPASTLFRQGTEFPAIERGTLEMSTGTAFEVAEEIPSLGFLDRAYLIRDYAHLRHIFDGDFGKTYTDTVASKLGIRILAVGYLGTREVNLREQRTVAKPSDLEGIKMRMPATPEWLLLGRTLDVSPVPMGMPEVYLALKTGTIDGQENPLTITAAAKFYEVTKTVVMTNHLVQPVFYDISEKLFQSLPKAQQEVLEHDAKAAMAENDKARLADESRVVALLKEKGLTVQMPDLAPFRANADRVYADSPLAKKWDQKLMQEVAAQ
jgi:tripartite ATP-independent transporter DctP family solute receptor